MLKDVSDMHRIVEVEENEVHTNTIQCLQLKGLLTNSIIQHVIFQDIISWTRQTNSVWYGLHWWTRWIHICSSQST